MASSAAGTAATAKFGTPTRFSPTTFFTMAAMTSATTTAGAGTTDNGGTTVVANGAGDITPPASSMFLNGTADGGTTPKSSLPSSGSANNSSNGNIRPKNSLRAQHQQRQEAAAAAVIMGAKNGGGAEGGRALNCPKSPNGGAVVASAEAATASADKLSSKRQQQSSRSKCQPQFGMSPGTAVPAAIAANGICATPSSRNQQHRRRHSIRREQSASAIAIPPRRYHHYSNNGTGISNGIGSNSSLYGTAHPYAGCYTPPSAIFYAHEAADYEVSPIFAGPKFIESPSAKSLPLPPPQWLEAYNGGGGSGGTGKKKEEDGLVSVAFYVPTACDENNVNAAADEDVETELQHNTNNGRHNGGPVMGEERHFGRLSVADSSPGRRTAGHSSFSESSSTSNGTSTSSGGFTSSSSEGEQYQLQQDDDNNHGNGGKQFSSIIPGNWSPAAVPTTPKSAVSMQQQSINKTSSCYIRAVDDNENNTAKAKMVAAGATASPVVGIRMDPLHLIQACYP